LKGSDNDFARDRFYVNTVFVRDRHDNNTGRGTLNVTYASATCRIDVDRALESDAVLRQPVTVKLDVTNPRHARDGTTNWFDGRSTVRADASLDSSGLALVDRGNSMPKRGCARSWSRCRRPSSRGVLHAVGDVQPAGVDQRRLPHHRQGDTWTFVDSSQSSSIRDDCRAGAVAAVGAATS